MKIFPNFAFKPALAARNSFQLLSINPFIKTCQDLRGSRQFQKVNFKFFCKVTWEMFIVWAVNNSEPIFRSRGEREFFGGFMHPPWDRSVSVWIFPWIGSASFSTYRLNFLSIFIERIPNNPKTPENSVCYTQNSGWWEKNVRISMLSPFSLFSIHGLLHSSLAGLVGLGKVKSEVIQQNCLLFDFGPDQII